MSSMASIDFKSLWARSWTLPLPSPRRQGEHHGIQQDIGSPQDAVLPVIRISHLAVFRFLMLLPMQRLHLCHESVQFTHIGRSPGHALPFVRQIVKVKLRHLYAAADTDRIEVVLSAVAGILHIQRAAALNSGSAAQLGHVHDVGSYLQVRSHCAHRGRLGMVLGGHKL